MVHKVGPKIITIIFCLYPKTVFIKQFMSPRNVKKWIRGFLLLFGTFCDYFGFDLRYNLFRPRYKLATHCNKLRTSILSKMKGHVGTTQNIVQKYFYINKIFIRNRNAGHKSKCFCVKIGNFGYK